MARLIENPFEDTCNVCDAAVGEREGWTWKTDPIRPWPVVCDGCDEDRLITRFDDGTELTFGRGTQDAWCVYEGPPKRALRDADYFARLARLAEIQDPPVIYGDFITIYEATGDSVDEEVLDEILAPLEEKYGCPLGPEALKVFTILYATMVAEERKRGNPKRWRLGRLGKWIKRLGVYHLLYEGLEAEQAATFCRGMDYEDLERLCRKYGF